MYSHIKGLKKPAHKLGISKEKQLLQVLGINANDESCLDPFPVKGLLTSTTRRRTIPSTKVSKDSSTINSKFVKTPSESFFEDVKEDNRALEDPCAGGLYFLSRCIVNDQSKLKQLKTTDNLPWIDGLESYGWGSNNDDKFSDVKITCRCMSCETRASLQSLSECKVFLLIDVDNWGLEELYETRLTPEYFDIWKNCFLWMFYGGGKRKKGCLSQKEKDIFDSFEGNRRKQIDHYYLEDKEHAVSILDFISSKGHLRFSPCGWKNQASDLSILSILPKLVKSNNAYLKNVVVISRDKTLIQRCEEVANEALLKQITSNDNGTHTQVLCLDANKDKKVPQILEKMIKMIKSSKN